MVPKTDANGAEVEDELVEAKELKIAKMGGGQHIGFRSVNGVHTGELFMDMDIDRFYIQVPNLPVNDVVSVKFQTGHTVLADYRDTETIIDLKYDNEKKVHTSQSMILVSDDHDDDHSQNALGEENDMFVDGFRNDRTHKAFIGGLARVSKITVNNEETVINKQLDIKKKKKVTVTVWRIKNQTDNLPYVPLAKVNQHIKVMKERFAQIGLEVNVIGPNIKEIPNSVNLDDGYQIVDAGNEGVTQEEIDFLNAVATPAKTDIEIFYVEDITDESDINTPSAAGYSYIEQPNLPANEVPFQNSLVMSDGASEYVLAHELAHILIRQEAHDNTASNLLGLPVHINYQLGKPMLNYKRLKKSQETIMLAHPQIVNP